MFNVIISCAFASAKIFGHEGTFWSFFCSDGKYPESQRLRPWQRGLSHMWVVYTLFLMKKNARRQGCSQAEPNIFARGRPLPGGGGAGRPKFNQLEMVTTYTYRPSLVKIDADAFSSYRGNRPTKPQTHKQDRLQYAAALASTQCKYGPQQDGQTDIIILHGP